jgi:hypothetical protein
MRSFMESMIRIKEGDDDIDVKQGAHNQTPSWSIRL